MTLFLQTVLAPASREAKTIKELFSAFNIAALAMLLFVCACVIYICFRYRRKAGDDDQPLAGHNNNFLEAAMIGLPLLILVFFFYRSVSAEAQIAPTTDSKKIPDVIITAHQWWWEVQYPKNHVIAANEIHLPVGRPILMEMRSADVIHDWWVPSFGNKIDLIPDIKNYLRLNIIKPGTFMGACSEFCGAEHAWMRIKVIAEMPEKFNMWLQNNGSLSAPVTDSISKTGAMLFQEKSCAGCHRIGGTDADMKIGPDLTHLAGRQDILTGLLVNNRTNLAKWIGHAQEVKPGAYMPDFSLSKDSLTALVHYLSLLE
ncbi:MAG TPA: cytochrome c oxidase subunit II [Puia sp.]|jgi:cytochrome c oxidase subunit 2